MNGMVSDHVAGMWLAPFLSGMWVALCVTDPARSGLHQSEVTGGSYKRMAATFQSHDARTIWLTEKLTWNGMPHVIISHIAIVDRAQNGNLMSAALLPDPKPEVRQGATFELDAYTYAISIGLPA